MKPRDSELILSSYPSGFSVPLLSSCNYSYPFCNVISFLFREERGWLSWWLHFDDEFIEKESRQLFSFPLTHLLLLSLLLCNISPSLLINTIIIRLLFYAALSLSQIPFLCNPLYSFFFSSLLLLTKESVCVWSLIVSCLDKRDP